ncbi:hypothetical protein NP493_72g00007 [Ridgeia piscesae]|uniref:PiggyBac transposable element-derived protein domain-containing protein n=1 Tax=Ridgeia piscesae TaxID=27915 RepID=A0AAD9P9K0_RIDPI|nr:hypothetical protein NP493_72g00007 [Ridgeia piscesae]
MGHPAHGYPPLGWSMAMPTPRIRPFREKSGPQHNIPFDAPELDFLLAVLGRNFFADMATLTNAYAVVHGGRLWADTTEDEICFFFGILILMGVNERPQYRDYWSTDPALNCPYISSRITRNRFEQLMHCIHLSSSYLLRNQHLYADNFYSSLGLIRDLHDAIAYFCGTIWKNSRGLPKQISDMALQRGQSEKLSADRDIVFCRWMAVMHQMCDNFSSRKRAAMGSIHAFLQTGARLKLVVQHRLYRHQTKVTKSHQEALNELWSQYKQVDRMSMSEYLHRCSDLMDISED